ncbi:MAG: PAS domain-containing sensor histidine kinase [Rhodospirillum sp.]|jgi:two-component system, LuxR family, sensor kinase FixL|nr:PAS domain-containing sensor histidine kinase [Rhodospirillum sp.]
MWAMGTIVLGFRALLLWYSRLIPRYGSRADAGENTFSGGDFAVVASRRPQAKRIELRQRPTLDFPHVATLPGGSIVLAKARSVLPSRITSWSALVLAIVIFLVDTFSPLQTAVAVFYVIVIMLVASSSDRRTVMRAAIACVLLTLGSFAIVHGAAPEEGALIRCIVSLSAIGITSFLAMRNRAAETALREQANLLELTHDAIFVRDMNDTIRYWNRGSEELYGWQRRDVIGQSSHILLKTRFSEPHNAIQDALLKIGRWEGELVHTGKDGRRIVVASRWSLQKSEHGKPIAVLETNTDITAQTQAHEALLTTQSALAHATRVATLGELSASIAHEINQPLAAIVTSGEAALRWLGRDQPDLPEARAALGRVISDGRRAGEVIRHVRALAKKGEQRMVVLNVNEVLNESLALVQREMAGRGIVVQRELDPALSPIKADRIQLQQVFINLAMNAIQAMDSVEPDRRSLVLRTFAGEDGGVSIQVRDNGIGLDDETEKRLFNAFFTTKPSGMGMGLSICRSIVEAHNGRIWATRNTDGGTTFQLSLPAGASA